MELRNIINLKKKSGQPDFFLSKKFYDKMQNSKIFYHIYLTDTQSKGDFKMRQRENGSQQVNTMLYNEEQKQFIHDLYKSIYGYVSIKTTQSSSHFLNSKKLSGNHPDQAINNLNMLGTRHSASMCAYMKSGNTKLDNVKNVCALAVDVFVQNVGEKPRYRKLWKKVLDIIEQKNLPIPTYVSFGNTLRLIFIMSSPVCLKISDSKKRSSTISWLNAICAAISKKYDMFEDGVYSLPCKLTDSVLLPDSVYLSYERHFVDNEFFFTLDDYYKTRIFKCGPEWEIHNLSNAVLDSYEEYLERQKVKRKVLISIRPPKTNNIDDMLENRLLFLKKIQKYYNKPCSEETLTSLFWKNANQLYRNEGKAYLATKKFNDGFIQPRKETLAFAVSQNYSIYNTHAEFLEKLKMNVSDALKRGFKMLTEDSRREYMKEYNHKYYELKKKEQIKAGKTKKQKMLKLSEAMKKLRSKGKKIREIAENFAVSVSTVERYLKLA